MEFTSSEMANIACCICGTSIKPNQVNMCIGCLKDRVDVTEGISRQETVQMCSTCGKFKGEGRWLYCEPESTELMALCLKSVHGLGKGKGKGRKGGATFVDASWIWTEPHSRRLKIKVAVEKEVFNGACVRQSIVVEYIVKTRLCDQCTKETTDQNWTTVVQVRQHVAHKKTLLNLENKLVRGGGASQALDITPQSTGIDFKFATKTQGLKFSEYVLGMVPAKRKETKHLQGADLKSNTYNYRYVFAIQVVPICKHDFVVLPTKLQHSLFGGKSAAVLVSEVTKILHLVDPFTGVTAKLQDSKFWQNQFSALATSRDYVEFSVLDVVPLSYSSQDDESLLAEVEVARASDLGINDERFTVTSHIGLKLEPGDSVLGFDFVSHNLNDELLKPLKGRDLPSIVLVQKMHQKVRKSKKKKGKSSKLRADDDDANAGEELEDDNANAGEELDGDNSNDETTLSS
mmetsp:Transcript_27142/g.43598  ORF Transcript_27142/g.43598 Transcript_27142/m.43598 type:complete len:460 (+) Transcript_27142:430-1809(+)